MGRRRKQDLPLRSILCPLMADAGLSVREAAKIAGVPPSTLANWRAGANPDDYIALKNLARHFGVTLAYLLTGEDDLAQSSSPAQPPEAPNWAGRLDALALRLDHIEAILAQRLSV